MKKMVMQMLLASFCILFVLPSIAQEKFKPGAIIRNNGDSTTGFIYNTGINRNPDEILFRASINDQPVKYTADEISGFVVDNRLYRSAVVAKNAELPSPVPTDAGFVLAKDTVFLQVLIEGAKSLAVFRDKSTVYNFYIGTDTGYHLLLYKKYLRSSGGNSFMVDINLYKNELNDYLAGCSDISKHISDAKYKQAELLKVFNEYYKCRNLTAKYKRVPERTKREFGVLLGATVTRLRFLDSYPMSYFDFPSSTTFTGGVFLNIVLPRNLKKLSINNELTYSSYKTKATAEYSSIYDPYKLKDFRKIGASYVKLNNLIRFTMSAGGPSLYLQAGISNGIVVSKTNYAKAEIIRFNTSQGFRESPAVGTFRNLENGFIAGIGAMLNRCLIDARWEASRGMASGDCRVSRYSLLLGYRLK